MGQTEAGRVLVQYLMDEAFRAAMDADPEGTLAGLPLSAEARDALLAGDARVLTLISEALRAGIPEGGALRTPAAQAQAQPAPHRIGLPPVTLFLTLQPHAARDDQGLRVQYLTSVHGSQVPPPTGVATTPDAPVLPGVTLRVQVAPEATAHADGSTWSTTWPALAVATGQTTDPTATRRAAMDHDLDAPAVQQAAAAVRGADAASRYDRILDLIAAMKGQG